MLPRENDLNTNSENQDGKDAQLDKILQLVSELEEIQRDIINRPGMLNIDYGDAEPHGNQGELKINKSVDTLKEWLGIHSDGFKKIREILTRTPAGVTELDLSCRAMGLEMYGSEFKELFAMIPLSVTKFDLSRNQLFRLKDADWIKFFEAIPRRLNYLNLKGNNFAMNISNEAFLACIKALPPHLLSLNISDNELDLLSAQVIRKSFAGLPKNLSTLNLRKNSLFNYSVEQLHEIFSVLPRSITNLFCSRINDNSMLDPRKLSEIFQAMPRVNFLDFSVNALGKVKNFGQAFQVLPTSIEYLDLDSNNFDCVDGDELADIFKTIAAPLKSLYLGSNWCEKHRGNIKLNKVFQSIPSTVNYLSLENNALGSKSLEEIINAFAAIPASVAELNLQRNQWWKFSKEALKQIFYALPKTVHTLYFSEIDHLHQEDKYNLMNFTNVFEGIPRTVERLHIGPMYNTILMNFPEKMIKIFQSIPDTISALHLEFNFFLEGILKKDLPHVFSALPKGLTLLDISADVSLRYEQTDQELLDFVNLLPINISELIVPSTMQERVNAIMQGGRQHVFDTIVENTPLIHDVASLVMNYSGSNLFWRKYSEGLSKEKLKISLEGFLLR